MNAREKDAHLDLCRRLAAALAERDAARAEVAAEVREAVEQWARGMGARLLASELHALRRAIHGSTR